MKLLQLTALSVLLAGTGLAAVRGAIWTTNSTGTQVNANKYDAKTDVYLSGGPQNMHSPGLAPDGTYYFQVTDPSGKVLLSTDNAVCREVTVVAGRMVGIAVASQTAGCAHLTGTLNVATGTLPVQLAPFADTPNPGCEYKAWLILKSGATVASDKMHLKFSNSNSKTDNFKVCAPGSSGGGGGTTSTISGVKFYDANANGKRDPGEELIPGWQISLFGAASNNTTTDVAGFYSFINLDAGAYGVCEVLPFVHSDWFYRGETKWVPTTPTAITGINVPPDSENNDFGNVCLGPKGAHNRFWWSRSSNGGAVFTSADLALLVSLNLRTKSGADFDPTSFSEFKAWESAATTSNMAYQLSAQLAAFELDLLHGFIKPTDLIYAPFAKGADSNGLITAAALALEANLALSDDVCGSTCFIGSGSSMRNYYFHLENHLDKANTDKSFVQEHACVPAYTGKEGSCIPK